MCVCVCVCVCVCGVGGGGCEGLPNRNEVTVNCLSKEWLICHSNLGVTCVCVGGGGGGRGRGGPRQVYLLLCCH